MGIAVEKEIVETGRIWVDVWTSGFVAVGPGAVLMITIVGRHGAVKRRSTKVDVEMEVTEVEPAGAWYLG